VSSPDLGPGWCDRSRRVEAIGRGCGFAVQPIGVVPQFVEGVAVEELLEDCVFLHRLLTLTNGVPALL
jgi:hypothetical protein